MSDAAIDAIEQLVVAGVALTERALAGAATGLELTLAQWRVLVVLSERPEGMRLSGVSAHIGVTLPATGRQLRRLEQRGLVSLSTDATDRRATNVTLTRRGSDVVEQILRFRREELRRTAGEIEIDATTLDRLDAIARQMREFL